MLIQKLFRIDDTVPLPDDTAVLRYNANLSSAKAGCGGGSCGTCSTERNSPIAALVADRFLAVSPKAASYVVLELDALEPFENLLGRKTIREARDGLVSRVGRDRADQIIHSVLKNVLGRNFFQGAEVEEAKLRHPHMQMYVTNRCNLRCKHCYMSSGEALAGGEIGTEDRLNAIELFAELCPGSKITFTGGEALLSKDIFVLLKRARAAGLRTELYSNGLTIKDHRIAERVANAVDEVQISIDGATEHVNDLIRGKGTFQGIVRGIRLLDEAQTRVGVNFRFRLAVTLTSTNVDDIRSNIHAFVSQLNLNIRPEVRIGTVGRLGRAKQNPEFCGDHDALQAAQAEIVNEFARSGMHRMKISAVNRFTKTCGMGLSITIGADGKIYPCTITDQRPIGNIRDPEARTTIANVVRYSESTNVDNVVGCKDCGIRYFCGGICRITNQFKAGSMNKSACYPEYKNTQIRNLIARYDSYGLS
jgi:radical SAM protein with 4Fe4S-binding SPASM domain